MAGKRSPYNPVKPGYTRITYNPGSPNEKSTEYRSGTSSVDVPGSGMAKGAAKAIEKRKKQNKKAGK